MESGMNIMSKREELDEITCDEIIKSLSMCKFSTTDKCNECFFKKYNPYYKYYSTLMLEAARLLNYDVEHPFENIRAFMGLAIKSSRRGIMWRRSDEE